MRQTAISELDGELPQTLQHAFRLARLLGIRYLWIDALCIVQDDPEEWELEAAKMGLIYSNAFLVISAIVSSHAGDDLFKPRGADGVPHRIMTGCLSDATGKEHTIYARKVIDHEIITSCRAKPHRHWEENISMTFPLLSRAWGFQERLLATESCTSHLQNLYGNVTKHDGANAVLSKALTTLRRIICLLRSRNAC